MADLKNLFNNLSALGNTATRWMSNPRLFDKLTTDPSVGASFANVSRRLGNAASLASPLTKDTLPDIIPTSAGEGIPALGRLGMGGNLAAMFDSLSSFAKLPASAKQNPEGALDNAINLLVPRMLK